MPKPIPSHTEAATSFWARLPSGDGCWVWTGARQAKGYGRVWFRGRIWGTHRLAWFLTRGEIHAALQVCHRCDNPPCCNPAHLFLGTNEENVADMMRKGRFNVGSRPRGADVHNARLTEADVLEIRRLHAVTGELTPLARRFRVTRQNIYRIVTGRSWRHVKEAS